MIDQAIEYVVSELNAYLNVRSPAIDRDRLVAGSLYKSDGNVNTETQNKIVLCVVNIEQDPVYRSVETYQRRGEGPAVRVRPEVKVNLYALFVANLGKYQEALKALSHIIAFFQNRSSFDYSHIPALADRRGRVVFEIFSLTFEQVNHLWGALGAKYMPSVMYKVGIVDIVDAQIQAEIPPVEGIWVNA
ncbi:MAG: DUF4255 domain-containing protein [Acidobacteria bacterium]|nr:MAG: DUF4255 domain-containing protein [Acidobacteriota bacterium]